MSIVAISDTLGSRGDAMGRELARRLGWQLVDRDVIPRRRAIRRSRGDLHESRRRVRRSGALTTPRGATCLRRGQRVRDDRARRVSRRPLRHLSFATSRTRCASRHRTEHQAGGACGRISPHGERSQDAVARTGAGERAARMLYLYHIDMDDAFLMTSRQSSASRSTRACDDDQALPLRVQTTERRGASERPRASALPARASRDPAREPRIAVETHAADSPCAASPTPRGPSRRRSRSCVRAAAHEIVDENVVP